MRVFISVNIGVAISSWFPASSNFWKKYNASSIGISARVGIVLSLMKTFLAISHNLEPSHLGQVLYVRYFVSSSRTASDSVSA